MKPCSSARRTETVARAARRATDISGCDVVSALRGLLALKENVGVGVDQSRQYRRVGKIDESAPAGTFAVAASETLSMRLPRMMMT